MPPLNLPAVATPPIQAQGQNPLEQLRLMQIMSGGTPPNQGAPTPSGEINPAMLAPETNPPMMGGYQPETGAADRFNEMLQNYPESEKRGMLEKIALSMMALNDPQLVQQIMQQSSPEQLDWQEQIGPAESAMQQERLGNVNMRQIADMLLTGRQADVRIGQASERIDISRAAQELSEWKAQHPNMQLKTREDGMIVGISPLDPTQVIETGVKSGDLSDQEKEEARIEAAEVSEAGRVGRAKTATGERKTAATLREGQRKGAATLREERLRGRPSKPGVLTESSRTTRRLSAAEELKNRDPSGLGKWITIDGRNVEVAEPGKVKAWWPDKKGPTSEEHQKIMDTLYPNGGSKADSNIIEKPLPDGSGMAISRDGGKTWKRK